MASQSSLPDFFGGQRDTCLPFQGLACSHAAASPASPLFVLRWFGRSEDATLEYSKIDSLHAPFLNSTDSVDGPLATETTFRIRTLVDPSQGGHTKMGPSRIMGEGGSKVAVKDVSRESTAKDTGCRTAKISRKGVPRRRVVSSVHGNGQPSEPTNSDRNGGRTIYERRAREMTVLRAQRLDECQMLWRIFDSLSDLVSRKGLVAPPEDEAPHWKALDLPAHASRVLHGHCSTAARLALVVSGQDVTEEAGFFHGAVDDRESGKKKRQFRYPRALCLKAGEADGDGNRRSPSDAREAVGHSAKRLKAGEGLRAAFYKDKPQDPLGAVTGTVGGKQAGVDDASMTAAGSKERQLTVTPPFLRKPVFKRRFELDDLLLEYSQPRKAVRRDGSSESLEGLAPGECSSRVVQNDESDAGIPQGMQVPNKLSKKAGRQKVRDVCVSREREKETPEDGSSRTSTFEGFSGTPFSKGTVACHVACERESRLAVAIPSSRCSPWDRVKPPTLEALARSSNRASLDMAAALTESASVTVEEAAEVLASSGLIPGLGAVQGCSTELVGEEGGCSLGEAAEDGKVWLLQTLEQSSSVKTPELVGEFDREGDETLQITATYTRRRRARYVAEETEQLSMQPGTSSSAVCLSATVIEDSLDEKRIANEWLPGGEPVKRGNLCMREKGAARTSMKGGRRREKCFDDAKMSLFGNDSEIVTGLELTAKGSTKNKRSWRKSCKKITSEKQEAAGKLRPSGPGPFKALTAGKVETCPADAERRGSSSVERSRRHRSAPFWLVRYNVVDPLSK